MIHQSHVRLLLFVVSRWETTKLCPKTDLRYLWIVSYYVHFFLFFVSDVHRFLPILSRSDVRPPRVLHIVFMFINRQHFISRDIQWHVTVFSVFFVKGKVEFVTLSANCEWFIIKLCGIGIILFTDLLCGITSYYFSINLRFDCIFKKRCKRNNILPYHSNSTILLG